MEKNVFFDESGTLEKPEQQQPAVRNAPLRMTQNDVLWFDRRDRVTGDEDSIQGAADALGTDSPDLALTTIIQMIDLHGGRSGVILSELNANLALLSGFNCKDPQELMMAVQLVALHRRAIKFAIQDATRSCFMPGPDHLDETLKVMRVFKSLMETFNRHRRNQALLMKD